MAEVCPPSMGATQGTQIRASTILASGETSMMRIQSSQAYEMVKDVPRVCFQALSRRCVLEQRRVCKSVRAVEPGELLSDVAPAMGKVRQEC